MSERVRRSLPPAFRTSPPSTVEARFWDLRRLRDAGEGPIKPVVRDIGRHLSKTEEISGNTSEVVPELRGESPAGNDQGAGLRTGNRKRHTSEKGASAGRPPLQIELAGPAASLKSKGFAPRFCTIPFPIPKLTMTERRQAMSTNMKAAELRHLHNMVHDFKTAAVHVESEIRSYGLCRDSKAPVPGMEWRMNRDMWASMKEVSHFNLGTALELMLKMILVREKVPRKKGHRLAALYDEMPGKERKKLDSTFDEIFKTKPVSWVAFITQEKTAPRPDDPFASMKERPKRTDGSSLMNFFRDFDDKARLWEKRYAWEDVEKNQWRYYLDDISAFTELIDRVTADTPPN